MSRISRWLLFACALFCGGAFIPLAAEVILNPVAPGGPAAPPSITVTFSSEKPGNLFTAGEPLALTAHVANPFDAQDATVSIQVLAATGCVYAEKREGEALPEQGTLDEAIRFGDATPLPRGAYTVTVLVFGQDGKGGFGATHVGIWGGPAAAQSPLFGVNYRGPLDGPRVTANLDLFKSAGFGWVRFPFAGWLPQGEKMPPLAAVYSTFAREVVRRGMGALAAFSPTVTVDPGVNPEKAVQNYTESLLSAAAHCAADIKWWELLCVPPPAFPDNMRGITYAETAKGRTALREFDKTVQVVYPIDETIRDTMQLTTLMRLPAKEDAFGFHFEYADIPESDRVQPRPPVFDMGVVREKAQKALRRMPNLWATDFGFNADVAAKWPDVNQAALMARAVILNKVAGIDHTLWRSDPAVPGGLPLVSGDGSAMPGLLAMRTVLQALDGMTSIKPVQSSVKGVNLFVLQFGKKTRSTLPRTVLVAWCNTGMDRLPMLIKTTAPQVRVTDLWGNALDLFPMDNIAIFQVDGYPRFIDVGTGDVLEIGNARGCGGFDAPALRITPAGANSVTFSFHNDPMIFRGKLTGEVRCIAWPLSAEITRDAFSLDNQSTSNTTIAIPLPADRQLGRILCEVNAQIYIGNRRMGFMTAPVYYTREIQPD